jgi:hypothetical protein
MSVKEWLNRAWVLNCKINELTEKQERAFSRACKTTSTIVEDKVQACGGKSREDWVITYTEYADEINNKIDELYKIKCEILNAIKKVDNDTYKVLLILRYIKFKSWGKIAECIGKTEINTRVRVHSNALKAITQYIV